MKKYIFIIILALFFASCGASKEKNISNPGESSKTPLFDYQSIPADSLSGFMEAYARRIKYNQFNSLLYSGLYIYDGKKFPVRYYHQKGESVWFEMQAGGQKIYPYIFTKEKKLKWTGETYAPLKAEEERGFLPYVNTFWQELPVYLYKKGFAFRLIQNVKKMDGIDVKALAVLTPQGYWHFYFDKKHGFLVRIEKLNLKRQKLMNLDFMDFRPRDGVDLARYWIVYQAGQKKPIKIIWKNIKMNYIETLKM